MKYFRQSAPLLSSLLLIFLTGVICTPMASGLLPPELDQSQNASQKIGTMLPVASFTSNATMGIGSFSVQFADTSTDSTSWYWNFGDSHISREKNPVHTFSIEGVFDVTHSATNKNGTSWNNKTSYITSLPVITSSDGILWNLIGSAESVQSDWVGCWDSLLYGDKFLFNRYNATHSIISYIDLTTMSSSIINNTVTDCLTQKAPPYYVRMHSIDDQVVVMRNDRSNSAILLSSVDLVKWGTYGSTNKLIGQDFVVKNGTLYITGSKDKNKAAIAQGNTLIWSGTVRGSDDGMGALVVGDTFLMQDAYPTNVIYSTDMSTFTDMWNNTSYTAPYTFDWAWHAVQHDSNRVVIPSHSVNSGSNSGFAIFNVSSLKYSWYPLDKWMHSAIASPDLMGGMDGPFIFGANYPYPAVVYRYNMDGTLGKRTMQWMHGSVQSMSYDPSISPYIFAVVHDNKNGKLYILKGEFN